MRSRPRHAAARQTAHPGRLVSCVLALVACLMLPGLHALHAPGHADHSRLLQTHGGDPCHHGDEHEPLPGRPEHDPSTCEVCCVYAGIVGGTDTPPAAGPVTFAPYVCEVRAIIEQDTHALHAARELPARGPPR